MTSHGIFFSLPFGLGSRDILSSSPGYSHQLVNRGCVCATDTQKWKLSLLRVLKWRPERLLSITFPVPNPKCIIRGVTGFVAQCYALS